MTQDEVVDLRFIGEQVRRLGLKVGPMEEQLRHLSSELSHFRQAINLQFQSIELALNQVRIQTNAVDAQLANQQRVLDELLARQQGVEQRLDTLAQRFDELQRFLVAKLGA
jgi:chromosome segregation ATPase